MKKYIFIVCVCVLMALSACHGRIENAVSSTASLVEGVNSSTVYSTTVAASTTQGELQSMATIKSTTVRSIDGTEPNRVILPYPKEITPEIEKNAEAIFEVLGNHDPSLDFSRSDAEHIAKRFYAVGIPEIVEVDVVETLNLYHDDNLKSYRIHFIDINKQDYFILLNPGGNFADIIMGKEENQEVIYFPH